MFKIGRDNWDPKSEHGKFLDITGTFLHAENVKTFINAGMQLLKWLKEKGEDTQLKLQQLILLNALPFKEN